MISGYVLRVKKTRDTENEEMATTTGSSLLQWLITRAVNGRARKRNED